MPPSWTCTRSKNTKTAQASGGRILGDSVARYFESRHIELCSSRALQLHRALRLKPPCVSSPVGGDLVGRAPDAGDIVASLFRGRHNKTIPNDSQRFPSSKPGTPAVSSFCSLRKNRTIPTHSGQRKTPPNPKDLAGLLEGRLLRSGCSSSSFTQWQSSGAQNLQRCPARAQLPSGKAPGLSDGLQPHGVRH